MDEIALRDISALCLPPIRQLNPEDIRRIRTANRMSQAAFATVLGIGKTTVQQGEQGQKKPSDPAKRLLDLIDRKGIVALG
ncbi:MAG: helix-turn-helix domain-containing protein [Syntrophobacteraceae bacterium]